MAGQVRNFVWSWVLFRNEVVVEGWLLLDVCMSCDVEKVLDAFLMELVADEAPVWSAIWYK